VLVIIGIVTLVAFAVSWVLARSLSVPLVRLTEAAQRMAKGDLDVQFASGGSRELSVLSELLNKMRAAIRTQLTALRQEVVVRREAEQALRQSERHFAGLAERNQRLVQEVEHRVRNNLAGLISLVGLMKSTSRDIDSFATAIESRLRAMAHVQRLLVESEWGQVGLHELIRSTIEAMRPLTRFQNPVDIQGPPVSLLPEQVTPLTLVLVEWFTNSTKYGAHSTPQGRLKINWEVLLQAQEPNIRLTWQERGGPRIDRPTTPSLGTDLVYGFVTRELRGQCWIQFPPEGAEHAIEFPCLLSPLPLPSVPPASKTVAG
jgi:two-component sensor histidine kinase/HAMP domain-containing protein